MFSRQSQTLFHGCINHLQFWNFRPAQLFVLIILDGHLLEPVHHKLYVSRTIQTINIAIGPGINPGEISLFFPMVIPQTPCSIIGDQRKKQIRVTLAEPGLVFLSQLGHRLCIGDGRIPLGSIQAALPLDFLSIDFSKRGYLHRILGLDIINPANPESFQVRITLCD